MDTFVALCAVGAEKILGNEIKKLGYKLAGNAPGQVSFTAELDAMYRANMCLRTCDRIYLQLAEYEARNFDDLFEGAYQIAWEDIFRKNARVVVDKVRLHDSRLDSEHSVQGMIHKAIYTRLGDVWHMRSLPESGERVDVRVYVEKDFVKVLLDTSGEALHKRGYRTDGGVAPLRETTAAVLLQEMLWRRKTPLVDPFCGSGTIVGEALLYAHDVAPGIARNFAFENFVFYDEKRLKKIRLEEARKIRTDVEVRIAGSDSDEDAIIRAQKNISRACAIAEDALQMIGSDAKIARPEFMVADFADLSAQYEHGLILTNPPYGERLGDAAEAERLYKKMSVLWQNFPAWEFGVITTNKKFQECFGHYASLLKSIKAGNLDTCLYIYRGTEKAKKQRSQSEK